MNRLSKEYTITNNKEKVKAQYTYGKTGGVTLVTNDTSSIANKYDNKGLVMEQKLFEDGKSYAMVYVNNANGKCVYSKIYNNNTGHYGDYDIQQMINYEYDDKGNMTTVSDSLNNSKVMARYTYDSNDNLSSVTYGNGTSTSYTYNEGNMIKNVTNKNADSTKMSYYNYDYYLDGNVSQQDRNVVNCYYDYDEFSRIIDEDYGREEIDYYYDAAGNRTLKKICDDNGDTDVNYTYDLNNRLLEESNHSYANNKTDVTKYVYDNNGNQIKKIGYTTKGVNGSPSQDLVSENELNNTYEIYKYNEFNEMTSFESNKESKWEYAYLPNGLRYRKSNATNFDRYIWDRNGNIIAEINGEGNLTSKYVRGNKLISKNGNGYFGYDGHGSVVNISNESGKSIKSYDYDAFGVELNKDANDTNLFRYCGEQYDNETDSIYLRARYYSPSLGRFTTEDPAKDGNNWYSYCAGNPVNGWDPSGLFDYNTRLSLGSSGDDVKVLQHELQNRGFMSKNIVDKEGYFGEQTFQAVNNYKNYFGLGNKGKYNGVVGLQTWKKLGLIYREQKDINAGVEIITKENRQYFDMSVPVNTDLCRDKEKFANHKMDLSWFYKEVSDKGEWNIKSSAKTWAKTLGVSENSYNSNLILFEDIVKMDDIGNITYGYLGKVSGIPDEMLMGGSFLNYAKNHILVSFDGIDGFNDEREDQKNIKTGINWYNKVN